MICPWEKMEGVLWTGKPQCYENYFYFQWEVLAVHCIWGCLFQM